MIARGLRWLGCAFLGIGIVGLFFIAKGAIVIWPIDGKSIVEQAKANVKLTPYPPKPSGKTVQEQDVQYQRLERCAKVPEFRAFQLEFRDVCTTTVVPIVTKKERFVGLADDDTKKWQVNVDEIDRSNQERIAEEIKQLEHAAAENRRAELKDWAQIFSPVASTVLGIGMLVLGMRKDRREAKVPQPASRAGAYSRTTGHRR
jgi:hypothetical protein